jgi:hypothetical protein
MSTGSGVAAESEQEILTKSQLAARHLIMNRPKRLNALNWNMINTMKPQLEVVLQRDINDSVFLVKLTALLKGVGKIRPGESRVTERQWWQGLLCRW